MKPFIVVHAQKPPVFHIKKKIIWGAAKVLLLLDNIQSHVARDLPRSNMEVYLLPPDTTSKIQTMDAEIRSYTNV